MTTAVLTAVVALAGCAPADDDGLPVSGVTVHDDDGMHGAVLPDPYVVPPVPLTATDGSPYRLADDADAPLTLVFFGYTHCPDVCQLAMADITSALTRLTPEERARTAMTFVTTDPARDDAQVLRAYLDRFDAGFEGLTGPLRRVVRLGEGVGVPVEKGEKLPSGGYAVDHGTQVLGMTDQGRVPIVWTHGTPPEQIADDIRVLLDEGIPSGGTS